MPGSNPESHYLPYKLLTVGIQPNAFEEDMCKKPPAASTESGTDDRVPHERGQTW